jgi:hypothetical protein
MHKMPNIGIISVSPNCHIKTSGIRKDLIHNFNDLGMLMISNMMYSAEITRGCDGGRLNKKLRDANIFMKPKIERNFLFDFGRIYP